MGGGAELIGRVMYHPAQLAAAGRVAGLIEALRLLKTPAELSEFQKALFQEVHSAQLAFQKASKQVKRATAGKTTEVPPVASQDWATERLVRDRIQRQFRAVGDALAWRLFNFDRRYILALSRNNDPGPMAGKEGLPYELGHVTDLWEKKGVFALLHDLTNCLRIADVTEFRSEGPYLREVKKTRRLPPGQLARMQRVVSVINDGAPLPGDLGELVSLVEVSSTTEDRDDETR